MTPCGELWLMVRLRETAGARRMRVRARKKGKAEVRELKLSDMEGGSVDMKKRTFFRVLTVSMTLATIVTAAMLQVTAMETSGNGVTLAGGLAYTSQDTSHGPIQGDAVAGRDLADYPGRDVIIVEQYRIGDGAGDSLLSGELHELVFGHRDVILFAPPQLGAWSLVNLTLCALACMYAAAAAVRAMIWKKRGYGVASDYRDHYVIRRDFLSDDDRADKNLRPGWLATAIAMAVISAMLFLMTQNLTHMMVLVDFWTLTYAALLLVEVIAITLVFRKKHDIHVYNVRQETAAGKDWSEAKAS